MGIKSEERMGHGTIAWDNRDVHKIISFRDEEQHEPIFIMHWGEDEEHT